MEYGNGKEALDGIVVCTPTFTHDAVMREAAEFGLHIFTEKPIEETADKIKDLFDICNKHGAKLCCGFQRRFDLTYKAVADAVRANKIGKPLSASIFFADHPCPPIEFLLTGGDIFMDLSAHDVDYIRYALNDDVESVYATGSSSTEELKTAGVYDNATMILTFKKGTIVTLTMSRSASYGYDQRCEIFGTEGLACVNNEFADSSIISSVGGIQLSRLKHSFPERFEAAFAKEIDVFADCILDKIDWPILQKDCIATQKIADAARKSAQTNEVVKVLY
jgi:myo-inositol 2-dehydrogenase/D-chiro-inositol 1-dehydrogenase